jgi:hypothetical protein
MPTVEQQEHQQSFELLKKYGTRWAVLTAWGLDLVKRGVSVPGEVNDLLKLSRMKIMSGCFSPCEVGCTLGRAEGQLVSVGASLGEAHVRQWFDLLGQAMQGLIDPQRMADIPALEPVATDCQFLACQCGARSPSGS